MKQICLFFLLALITQESFGQKAVYDEANDMQRQRMVFVRWNKFKPDGLISGLYWSILHPSYKKKDKRPLGPTGPYLLHEGLLQAQDNQDKEYRLSTDTMANKYLAEDANSEGGILDVPYAAYYEDMFEMIRTAKDNVILNEPQDVILYLDKNQILEWYNQESEVLDDRIKIIHQSYMDRGARILAYQRIEAQYNQLTDSFTKVVKMAHMAARAPVDESSAYTEPLHNYSAKGKSDKAIADEILRYYKF